ncbi:hypothetical protein [Vibrio sp. OPT18]|uniref:DUF7217 family protein n=1 Tax=Vibrio sp. OPT18 TaxID=2778641 RepID=UPI00188127CF|nr:hypothetical protein [Vibrio sp. OPT18]MBE8578713.1 hypothetical protein [Vibrio sp. OPT18]
MNIDIYKALGNGPITMTCPGLDGAKAAQNQTNDAIRKLNALGLDELQEVDLELINRIESKLGAANTAMDGAMGHMQHLADNALWLSSKSNMVATLDQMAGQSGSPCSNANKIFGPINGDSNMLFSTTLNIATSIAQKVDDYLSGVLDLPEFESFLSSVGCLIDDATAKFDVMVAEGKATIAEFEKKIMDSSFANTIDAVWNNPCTQAIMQSTLPDDIKQHLPSK